MTPRYALCRENGSRRAPPASPLRATPNCKFQRDASRGSGSNSGGELVIAVPTYGIGLLGHRSASPGSPPRSTCSASEQRVDCARTRATIARGNGKRGFDPKSE